MSRRIGFMALIVATGLIATGCSQHSAKSSSAGNFPAGSTGTAAGNTAPADAARDAPGAKVVPGAAETAPTKPASPLQQRSVVRTGAVSIEVGDVDRAADAVSEEATKAGGRVENENRSGNGDRRVADLVVRVPPEGLDKLMGRLRDLGHETNRTVKGDDVTAARADVDARVEAMRTSVARLRDFLKHSGTINDLVQLETQLSQREAELESTVGQQRALSDQVTLATLTVRLSHPTALVKHASHQPSGFGSAVGKGWNGIIVAGRWLLAAVGYALPFAVLLTVISLPSLVIRRRRRAAPEPAAAAESS
jgi:Ca-activated chloride channel family protein